MKNVLFEGHLESVPGLMRKNLKMIQPLTQKVTLYWQRIGLGLVLIGLEVNYALSGQQMAFPCKMIPLIGIFKCSIYFSI